MRGPRGKGRRRFSAMLTQNGIHVASFHDGMRGVRVERYAADLTRSADADQAIERLAGLLEAEGARGSRLALALSGFGSCHHLLTLPPAPREVLEPVVGREMRRFYPDIFAHASGEPVVDFLETDGGREGPGKQQEILAAALPRALVEQLHERLAARGIVLEHLTILPRAVQHLYRAFAEPGPTTATLLMVPQDPLLGFFHEGELRLFSEPMLGESRAATPEHEALVEQVERGALFIRQQFRGAVVERVLLSAKSESAVAVQEEVEARLGTPVQRFAAYGDEPGALAALGAALDERSGHGFNLLPAELRPRSNTERWVRGLAVATAAVLVLGVAGWAGVQRHRASAAEASAKALARQVDRRMVALSETRGVVRARQEHARRAVLLQELVRQHQALPELIWRLASAPPAIRLDSVALSRSGGEWEGRAEGTARARTSADAAAAVDELYRELSAGRPDGSVVLERLVDATPPDSVADPMAPVAIGFQLSFTVRPEEG